MAEDFTFQEAVEALHLKDRHKARKLLTNLLKTDQSNVNYWIWLSAAVDTTKEQIYCLKTVLQLDPDNATAKRGLILLGALPPDESVQPFPLNRPRAWEEELSLTTDRSEDKGLRGIAAKPIVRFTALGFASLVLVGMVVFGLVLPRNNPLSLRRDTPGPSPTFTLTPTFINATAAAPPPGATFVPLAELLDAPLTPTPLYVNTPRQPLTGDLFRSVKTAYESGDWDTVISSMKEVAKLEPEAADPYYYIGEAYRFKGEFRKALDAYNQALKINPQFGPPYLGLARARLLQDPNADVTILYNEALKRDPNFGEVYLDRAIFYLDHNKPELALGDLESAGRLLSDSPLVYYYEAQAYLTLGELDKALEAAESANQADVTLLPAYFILGKIYTAQGNYADAMKALVTYTNYETEDAKALTLLGQIYYRVGDCKTGFEVLGRSVSIDSRPRDTYLYRGLCFVEIGEADAAEEDLKRAMQVYKNDFEANLGLMRAYILQEHFGDAYLQGERTLSFAETDEEKALAYYWRAINFGRREEPRQEFDSWQNLLALPSSAVSAEMRKLAETRMYAVYTLTPSPTARKKTATASPTRTQTATVTSTPTKTATPRP